MHRFTDAEMKNSCAPFFSLSEYPMLSRLADVNKLQQLIMDSSCKEVIRVDGGHVKCCYVKLKTQDQLQKSLDI